MDTTTENTETSNEETAPVAEAAPAEDAPTEAAPAEAAADSEATAAQEPAAPKDPSLLGKLTPEEQQLLLSLRQQQQRLFATIGELTYKQHQIGGQIAQLEAASQDSINKISARLGVENGQQWAAMGNGEVRLVTPAGPGQNQGGGAGPSA